jgi:hypothetical protein
MSDPHFRQIPSPTSLFLIPGLEWGQKGSATARVYFIHFFTACDSPPAPPRSRRPGPWIFFGQNFDFMRGEFIPSAETGGKNAETSAAWLI